LHEDFTLASDAGIWSFVSRSLGIVVSNNAFVCRSTRARDNFSDVAAQWLALAVPLPVVRLFDPIELSENCDDRAFAGI
jgi:hypothetical protein